MHRLKILIDTLELSQKAFAEKLGISPNVLTELFKGRSKGLSEQTLIAIANEFKVNLNWLLTGHGDMFLSGKPSTPQQFFPCDFHLDIDTEELLSFYAALDQVDKKEVCEFAAFRAQRAGVKVVPFRKVKELSSKYREREGFVQVPLVGRIAAGYPILAEEHVEGYVPIPAHFLSRTGQYFALRVRGDSMTGAGILDRDIAILRQVSSVRDLPAGVIVAALIEHEATLKRLAFTNDSIELHAENPNYPVITLHAADFAKIQGRLAWILREFENN